MGRSKFATRQVLVSLVHRHDVLRWQGMRVSEFVMSNELVSMTLAMVSESREVNTILKELFTPEGNELYVHPASRYLRHPPPSSRL